MQIGFFTEDRVLEKLSKLGDSLEKLNIIDWEIFREILNKALKKEHKGAGGRPPYDYVMMFKILVLQRLYNLSDEQAEFQINDRMSFRRFLTLSLRDNVPDARTIWKFRDELKEANVIEDLFILFLSQLESENLISRTGSIVDATFVEVPKQRNNREENKAIKEGKIPEDWQEETSEAKHKLAQKDTDARWTIKNGERHYGYKDHAKVDSDSKLIISYAVSSANVHDSQVLEELLDKKDQVIFADSAYSGKTISAKIPEHIENKIHEKGYKNAPLTEEQKQSNKIKSKIRARVEHVFGYMTNSMNGIKIRSIGIDRAKFNIGLMNLVYNMCRYAILKKKEVYTG